MTMTKGRLLLTVTAIVLCVMSFTVCFQLNKPGSNLNLYYTNYKAAKEIRTPDSKVVCIASDNGRCPVYLCVNGTDAVIPAGILDMNEKTDSSHLVLPEEDGNTLCWQVLACNLASDSY